MTSYTFFIDELDTAIGKMLMVTDGEFIRAIDWKDHETRMQRLLQRHYGKNIRLYAPTRPSQAFHSLKAYFEGDMEMVKNLKPVTNGTAFQKKVWDELRKIPLGQTISYGELATNIGKPTAARAVGLANGSNPIAIVVPCHRVIGADLSLTGFGGGLARKQWLLSHENALPSSTKLLNAYHN